VVIITLGKSSAYMLKSFKLSAHATPSISPMLKPLPQTDSFTRIMNALNSSFFSHVLTAVLMSSTKLRVGTPECVNS